MNAFMESEHKLSPVRKPFALFYYDYISLSYDFCVFTSLVGIVSIGVNFVDHSILRNDYYFRRFPLKYNYRPEIRIGNKSRLELGSGLSKVLTTLSARLYEIWCGINLVYFRCCYFTVRWFSSKVLITDYWFRSSHLRKKRLKSTYLQANSNIEVSLQHKLESVLVVLLEEQLTLCSNKVTAFIHTGTLTPFRFGLYKSTKTVLLGTLSILFSNQKY